MFSVIPQHFLPEVKNPCWFEELRGNVSEDPYESNLFGRSFRRKQQIFEQLSGSFRQRLTRHDGKLQRLRCLPYFYIIGQPKCGTTDLYERLRLHPDVRLTPPKEPHWWTRKRLGRFVRVSFLCLSAFVSLSLQTKCSGGSSITTKETNQDWIKSSENKQFWFALVRSIFTSSQRRVWWELNTQMKSLIRADDEAQITVWSRENVSALSGLMEMCV